jgi:hypothetical protein
MTGDRWVALGGEDPPVPVLQSKVEVRIAGRHPPTRSHITHALSFM